MRKVVIATKGKFNLTDEAKGFITFLITNQCKTLGMSQDDTTTAINDWFHRVDRCDPILIMCVESMKHPGDNCILEVKEIPFDAMYIIRKYDDSEVLIEDKHTGFDNPVSESINNDDIDDNIIEKKHTKKHTSHVLISISVIMALILLLIDIFLVVACMSKMRKYNELKEHVTTSTINISTPTKTKSVVEENIVSEYTIQDYNMYSNFTLPSGLTSIQIDELLQHTELRGYGKYIYNTEQKYNINAYFIMAVASLESDYGRSNMAKDNNIFGMIFCNFNSIEECIDYFGQLMVEYQTEYNLPPTPNGIKLTYCDNDDKWDAKVVSIMNKYADKADELY